MKILLIDQDPTTLEKVQSSLTRAGYQVLIAADRDAGLRLARDDQPDLIILDILLTGLDGIDLCQELQKDKETRQIPVIIITTLTVPDRNEPWQPTPQAKWILLRYKEYLPKPVDLNALVNKVDALLKPEPDSGRPSGSKVFVVSKDDTQLTQFQQALRETNFDVEGYEDVEQVVPAIYAYLPASILIDSHLLSEDKVWIPISRFKERHPTFSLIVLHPASNPEPPEHWEQVDQVLRVPAPTWLVTQTVAQTLEFRQQQKQVELLSNNVLSLNYELTDSKHTLQYQNQELDLINRQLRQLDELKETLTGMLVHDLKAPLSAIMGALQFLTMDPTNTISESSLRILQGGTAAGQQMLRMTHTLLDEQKLENNQLVFDIELVDIEDPIETSVEMLSPLLNLHKVEVRIEVDETLPEIQADPIILQRVIENLLDNAIKYSPANEYITIRAIQVDDDIQISIADRGEGIPPEHRAIIFDRFTQLQDPKIEKVRGGVGLGLAFCKLAVNTMKGRIWVDSPDNIGTTFFFTLPLEAETAVSSSE
ncbi:MAG: ATP-binding protein [Chloroflexota bacterium]